MILSASGWRGIFAENGDEESPEPGISEAHRIIAGAAALVFSNYLSKVNPGIGAVIVGRDTRPTGEAIADAVIRALISEGRIVLYTGVSAAPEIMAFARTAGAEKLPVKGFIYISASHNPIGHNGIKFGQTDGGVLQGTETAQLVSAFRSLIDIDKEVTRIQKILLKKKTRNLKSVYAAADNWKTLALKTYRDFTSEVISGFGNKKKSEDFFASIRGELEKRPLGIAADFNGSARTVSIDRDFLESMGIKFHSINDVPGKIAHRIVPEGESLEPCRAFLEECHRKDPSIILGYMPDCDGDRGNLVIWDEGGKCARSLEAQEVFALACAAELSSLVWTGALKHDSQGKALTKVALAVNDPTSLRIDKIAGFFDAKVFRAEVGEANVVGLARKLREDGYLVRILGEGSAGGTITHPSAVRDPIDTLGAIIKLLALRKGNGEESGGMGLFEIWNCFSKQSTQYRENFSLADVIASLPAFVTTGAYSDDALLRVKTVDHGLLKERYQKIFLREWEEKKETLRGEFGFTGWEAIAYNGTGERRGIANFAEAGRGGLKIVFSGAENRSSCIWMRGSGTEPVFRVMADAEGHDIRLERTLIEWQRRMVLEADNF